MFNNTLLKQYDTLNLKNKNKNKDKKQKQKRLQIQNKQTNKQTRLKG